MSENKATANGTEATEKKERYTITFYKTKEEAEKNKPAPDMAEAWKVFGVKRPEKMGGETVWFWAVGHVNALAVLSKADGYEASSSGNGPRGGVSKKQYEATLAILTPEQRKQLGLPEPADFTHTKVDTTKAPTHGKPGGKTPAKAGS